MTQKLLEMSPRSPSKNDKEMEVKEILGWYKIGGVIHYYVDWKYYGRTWEPEENMTNCKELIIEFYKRLHNDRYLTGLFRFCNGFNDPIPKVNIYDITAKPDYMAKYKLGKGYIQSPYKKK